MKKPLLSAHIGLYILAQSEHTKLKKGDIDTVGASSLQDPNQKPNIHDSSIEALQTILIALDQEVKADGIFGPKTEQALLQAMKNSEYNQKRDWIQLTNTICTLMESELPEIEDETPQPGLAKPPFFMQNDPEWGHIKLNNKYTIGAAGCTLACAAMVISAITKQHITPQTLDEWLDNRSGYTQWDSIIWDQLIKAVKEETGKGIKYGRIGDPNAEIKIGSYNHNHSEAINVLLESGEWPMLRVKYHDPSRNRGKSYNHFVVANKSRIKDDKIDFHFLDPGWKRGGIEDHPNNWLSSTNRLGGYQLVSADYLIPT